MFRPKINLTSLLGGKSPLEIIEPGTFFLSQEVLSMGDPAIPKQRGSIPEMSLLQPQVGTISVAAVSNGLKKKAAVLEHEPHFGGVLPYGEREARADVALKC